MPKLDSYLVFVKEQQGLHEKLARRFEDQPWRRDLHISTASRFSSLYEDLVHGQKQLDEFEKHLPLKSARALENLALSPEDLEGLPDELLKELSISDADKLEFLIIGLVNEAGGALSLDKILIGIWRKTGEVFKRAHMTSRLYRMVQRSQLHPYPGRKGVYSIEEITEAAANKKAREGELALSLENAEADSVS